MPVIDASVLVEYLAGGEHAAQARSRLLAAGQSLWAPHLVDAEVGHVLSRAVMLEELRPSEARDALEDLAAMPIKRAAHVGLLDRAWGLRRNVSFYDALCTSLAPNGSTRRWSRWTLGSARHQACAPSSR